MKRCIKMVVFIDIEDDKVTVIDAHSEYRPVNSHYMESFKEAVVKVTTSHLSLLLPSKAP